MQLDHFHRAYNELIAICRQLPEKHGTTVADTGLGILLSCDRQGVFRCEYTDTIAKMSVSLSEFSAACVTLVETGVFWIEENSTGYLRLAGYNRDRFFKRKSRRTAVPKTVRDWLFGRWDGRCFYCRKPTTDVHIDHIIPWSRGGSNDWWNLYLACAPCNLSKSNKTIDEWGWNG